MVHINYHFIIMLSRILRPITREIRRFSTSTKSDTIAKFVFGGIVIGTSVTIAVIADRQFTYPRTKIPTRYITDFFMNTHVQPAEQSTNIVWRDFRLNGRRFALNSDLVRINRMLEIGHHDEAIKLCDELIFVKMIPDSVKVTRESPKIYYLIRGADSSNTITCVHRYKLGPNKSTCSDFGLFFTTIESVHDYINDQYGYKMVFLTVDLKNASCIFGDGKYKQSSTDKLNVVQMTLLDSTNVAAQYGLKNNQIMVSDEFKPTVDEMYDTMKQQWRNGKTGSKIMLTLLDTKFDLDKMLLVVSRKHISDSVRAELYTRYGSSNDDYYKQIIAAIKN
jgi:hypothetical protein